ncbi:hypothetical protein GCM10023188_40280 [Pontibacter saemangeumensis]|uniref:Uncharacterized protein n=2 Tax=Pontibacter saemangeumensis TaxID=1084525 RepID=A0ABP8M269_9BACT
MVILLLFTQCDAMTEEEPLPSAKQATTKAPDGVTTTLQTITTMDGAIAQVECSQEILPSGEIILMCMPAQWNGELILYAHGYVPEFEELALPDEAAIYMPLFTSFGYAFATTSYGENGIAVQSGLEDMINLRERFIQRYSAPRLIYLTGGSQGALITTLAMERHPELFSGGLSLCGPCGYFQGQLNYYGNFRVLFDYFFPGVLPGDAVHIPTELSAGWESYYVPLVLQAISQNPEATLKLLRTAQAPYDANVPGSIETTVIGVLTYDVRYIENAKRVFGGQPFDNEKQVYFGTGSFREDVRLNLKVQRFSADKTALREIRKNYETSGELSKPLVSGHTTKDPIVLYWNMPLYQAKTVLKGTSPLFSALPVDRYGHCTFTEQEIITAFGLLSQKVKGQELLARECDATGKIIRAVTVLKR